MKSNKRENISYNNAMEEMKKVDESAINNKIPKALHNQFKAKAAQQGSTIKKELVKMITRYVEN